MQRSLQHKGSACAIEHNPRSSYWTGRVWGGGAMTAKHSHDEDDDMGHNLRCHQYETDFLPQLFEE